MNGSGPGPKALRTAFAMAASLVLVCAHIEARAAERTDVIDAFDGKDPFDFNLGLSFIHELHKAKIVREGSICRERDIMALARVSHASWVHRQPQVFGSAVKLGHVLSVPVVVFENGRQITVYAHDVARLLESPRAEGPLSIAS